LTVVAQGRINSCNTRTRRSKETADEINNSPTIETVLERIGALEKKMDERFDRVDNEIDRVASVAHSTKAEMLTLRADFRELRTQLKEILPISQAS
jgi:hypothetical protein